MAKSSKSNQLWMLIALGLTVALIASNMYWYYLWFSSNGGTATLPENTQNNLNALLAKISKENQRLIANLTILKSRYEELKNKYKELREEILKSKELSKNLLIFKALSQINKSLTELAMETAARTSIGNFTREFLTPPQMLDTVLSITGSLYRDTKAVEDIKAIYYWVTKNIKTIIDQPTLRIQVVYYRVGNMTIAGDVRISYADNFIQTDTETLERGAGDFLDKALLLTSMIQEYLGEGMSGEAFLLYCRLPMADIASTLVFLKKPASYMILDPIKGVYGPYKELVPLLDKWIADYELSEKDLVRVVVLNNEWYFEGRFSDVVTAINQRVS